MSEKTPIRALIEALGAGVEETLPWRQVFGWDDTLNADAAHNGSLDAALALHDALLPGWWINHFDMEGFVQLKTDTDRLCDGECKGNPARAWLLAIMKAYEAQ